MWRRKKKPVDYLERGEAIIASLSSQEMAAMRREYWERVNRDPQLRAEAERQIADSEREIERIMREEERKMERMMDDIQPRRTN